MLQPTVSSARMVPLVANRNFVLLWLAYGVAAFGDHLSEMALLKERDAFNREDLTRVQALITFGFFLPFVLLGPLAGWWSDRFSRKTTMIMADLLRAVLVLSMALVVSGLTARLPASLGDYAIVIPLGLIGALAAFFSPARQALLPTLIEPDQLVRANAMISALGTIGAILSAVVGGYLVQTVGKQWNYAINAGTFTFSALCVGAIVIPRHRAQAHQPVEGVLGPMREGFLYLLHHRRVLQLILLGTVYWAAAGVVISVVPAIARLYYGENYAAAGTFRGLIALGLASGAAVMTFVGPRAPIPTIFLVGFGATAGWLTALLLTVITKAGPLYTGACLFGMGGAGASILVTVMASLQRFVPDSHRGRVFGVSDMSTMAAITAATGCLGLPHFPRLDTYIPWLLAATAAGLLGTMLAARRTYQVNGTRLWPARRQC